MNSMLASSVFATLTLFCLMAESIYRLKLLETKHEVIHKFSKGLKNEGDQRGLSCSQGNKSLGSH